MCGQNTGCKKGVVGNELKRYLGVRAEGPREAERKPVLDSGPRESDLIG